MKSLILALAVLAAVPLRAADTLSALVGVLAGARDAGVQLDILRGLRDATDGRPRLPMPAGWEAVEAGLVTSGNTEIRGLARGLGLTFGSKAALESLRATLADPRAEAGQRQDALRALMGVRDATLPVVLRGLLTDGAVRGAALRALAGFDDPATGPAVLGVYALLNGTEKRDALTTLGARAGSARELLAAMEAGRISSKDLTAEVLRQLRSLKDDAVNAALGRVYGTFREVGADKQVEITKYSRIYRAGGSTQGDATRGRAVFAKVCQQCHVLFEVGGQVGPDLTGSNRSDLEYILQNIIDPNAVIPNEYRASTVELKDGRILTGILKQQDDRSLTVSTANELLKVARSEVVEVMQSQLSMMPDGLVTPLADQEFRDLVYYLGRTGQTPMVATADTVGLFFNGRDLSMWHGGDDLWRITGGEVIGRAAGTLAKPDYLKSDVILGDFRLVLEFRSGEGSGAGWGVVFRAEPAADGSVRGYRVGSGGEGPGTLAEVGGRGKLGAAAARPEVRAGTWNTLEIVAVGSRVQTAINRQRLVDQEDGAGARRGIVALELRGGDGAEARYRNLKLELDPRAELLTVDR